MSVEFSNAYQEILFDNLVSIIKQNFIFQTQLKLTEKSSEEKENLQKKIEELTKLYDSSKIDSAQFEIYKNKAEQNSSAHEEKNRIQSALNESMKKNSNLLKEIEEKDNTIKFLEKELNNIKEHVASLENIIPVSKLKKIKNEKNDAPKNENFIIAQKVSDGSSF